jgi:hypothetical protein
MALYYVTAIGDGAESVPMPILVTSSWPEAMARARQQVMEEAGTWSQCEHEGDLWIWRCWSRWVAVERQDDAA